MHEFTVNLDYIFWLAGGIVALIGAVTAIKKMFAPYLNIIKQMQQDITELKEKRESCDKKFENDHKQMEDIREDSRMTMTSLILLMKHAETGNCTGEVAEGREKLDSYLVNRR